MTQEAYERGDWQAVIDGHPLESHDPHEWLRYGVALLQTLTPGPTVGRQQQQAALAFVQAQKEGATAEATAAAQRHSVFLSLREALTLADIANDRRPIEVGSPSETGVQQPTAPANPLLDLTVALARVFHLELPKQATVLDQLLVAKVQLRDQRVSADAVEEGLRRELPGQEQAWIEALEKVLLVLR